MLGFPTLWRTPPSPSPGCPRGPGRWRRLWGGPTTQMSSTARPATIVVVSMTVRAHASCTPDLLHSLRHHRVLILRWAVITQWCATSQAILYACRCPPGLLSWTLELLSPACCLTTSPAQFDIPDEDYGNYELRCNTNSYLQGRLAAVLVYTRQLSAADVSRLLTYYRTTRWLAAGTPPSPPPFPPPPPSPPSESLTCDALKRSNILLGCVLHPSS